MESQSVCFTGVYIRSATLQQGETDWLVGICTSLLGGIAAWRHCRFLTSIDPGLAERLGACSEQRSTRSRLVADGGSSLRGANFALATQAPTKSDREVLIPRNSCNGAEAKCSLQIYTLLADEVAMALAICTYISDVCPISCYTSVLQVRTNPMFFDKRHTKCDFSDELIEC